MRTALALGFFLLFVDSLCGQNEKSLIQDLKVDLVYLASDYLGGREAGTEYETLAADYIAQRFREIGLSPKGEAHNWYQFFDFNHNINPHQSGGEPRRGKNILGYIDNQSKTTVVLAAHYDHIGMGGLASRHIGEPAIHNGADDNASGVAALFRIADYLKNKSMAKQNNYLFLACSGEESGLLGSKYFVNNPTVELSTINYMLNMDMVGRLDQQKNLVINGAGTSPSWKSILQNIEVAGIKVTTTDSGVGPSDHTAFYLKDIPVLHFFTGVHQQYHKPGDDSQLINFPGLLDVSNYIIALIEELDKKEKLAFSKTKDESRNRKASAFKVTLGVMPDYSFQGEGMRIDGVLEARPAKKAELEGGDVLIQIGDTPVKDIYDYMEGLSKFKQGDKTSVKIKRGDRVLKKEVTFE